MASKGGVNAAPLLVETRLQISEAPIEAAILNSMFAFIHVPKAGGTSISAVLEQHHKLLRLNGWDEIRHFLETEGWRDGWTAATGHMPFGIDVYMPNTRYTIVLREPLDRIMSDYYYLKRTPDHPLHETATTKPLREFPGGNSMTRRLAHWRWAEMFETKDFWWQKYPWGYCTEEMLTQAKENLHRCVHVGLYETYEADAKHILSLAGIKDAEVPLLNATENRPSVSALDRETRELLEERNRYDIRLYEYAKELRS